MSDATIIFFLSACIAVLICIVLYQQFAFRTGTQIKLKENQPEVRRNPGYG